MKDNFDLKKFLTENKTFENFNPYTSEKEPLNENALRERIREMILAELGNPDYSDYDEEEDSEDDETKYLKSQGVYDLEDTELEDPYSDKFDKSSYEDDDLYEAKKKKDEEEAPEEEVDMEAATEEIPAEEVPAEETPAASGGLEDIAADMEGTEGDLMNHLMSALKIAKGMNNEKLETQVGNTLKFFVSQYIGGGND
jgi:hypothetical protein